MKSTTVASVKAGQYNLVCSEIVKIEVQNKVTLGSGCGTFSRGVASDTRDPQFESQQQQKFIYFLYNIEKTKIKKKSLG